MSEQDYADRVRAETATFSDQEHVHDLPPAYDHWSERFVRPLLAEAGVHDLDRFFIDAIIERGADGRTVTVLSIGSGNGDLEIGWFEAVHAAGCTMRLRLLELNTEMQGRARAQAERVGVGDLVEHVVADFNTWETDGTHDVVVANHSLHHVSDLEHLCAQIRRTLPDDGVLLVNDIIGRNGHRRWPEALDIVQRLWITLPPELRRNAITGDVDDVYPDVDCAEDGFEGVRAQDVLPVLLAHFHPRVFVAFANVVDPFVDRIYGGNFDLGRSDHREVLDAVGRLDEALCDLGLTSPTHLVASFATVPGPLRSARGRVPSVVVRDAAVVDPAGLVVLEEVAPVVVPLGGPGLPAARPRGVFADGWCAPTIELPLLPSEQVTSVRWRVFRPGAPHPGTVVLSAGGVQLGVITARGGMTEGTVEVTWPAGRAVVLTVEADWVAPVGEGDRRRVSYVLVAIDLVAARVEGEP